MDIAAYLKKTGKTKAELARELDVSRGHIGDLVNKRRSVGKKMALKLESVTGHAWWTWMGRA